MLGVTDDLYRMQNKVREKEKYRKMNTSSESNHEIHKLTSGENSCRGSMAAPADGADISSMFMIRVIKQTPPFHSPHSDTESLSP